jgi:hypothetical protein
MFEYSNSFNYAAKLLCDSSKAPVELFEPKTMGGVYVPDKASF